MKKLISLLLSITLLFSCVSIGVGAEEKIVTRHIIANFDDDEYTPADVTPEVPFEKYELGKALLKSANILNVNANSNSFGDTMLAMRVKDFGTYSAGNLNWTNMLIYDDAGEPKALKTGAKVYYIPTLLNAAEMVRFENVDTGIYCYTTTNSTFGLEFGYDGWIVFTLSDFNIDWWNGYGTIDGIKPEKITAFEFAAGVSNGTMIDEIQTFNGTVTDFVDLLNADSTDVFKRTMLADFDNFGTSPAQKHGTVFEIPYEGYAFGKAIKTGCMTVALDTNSNAKGQNMLAVWVKDSNKVNPSVANWTQFLLYSDNVNKPQAVNSGVKVYYIPTKYNKVDMSVYEVESTGLYSKNTENYEFRIDYGYEGFIAFDINDFTVDWWDTASPKGTLAKIAPNHLNVIDIAANFTNGSYIDEIQTFKGPIESFAQLYKEENTEVVDRSDKIGANGAGDYNDDKVINLLDLVRLKHKIANNSAYYAPTDIIADGEYSTGDLIAIRKYFLADIISGNTKQSDYIKDSAVWQTPSISQDKDFVYQAQVIHAGTDPWNIELLKASNMYEQTGDTTTPFYAGVNSSEWTSNELLPILKESANSIKSRQDAFSIVDSYILGMLKEKTKPFACAESFMRYQHYTAERGYDYIGCELGADISGSSVSVAFTRGAARQYGKAWFTDFSLWGAGTKGIGGTMLNYSNDITCFNGTGEAEVNNSKGGQGLSATRRHHLYSYMAGTSWLINEAGGNNAFYTEKQSNGYYKLSPHGEVFKEVNAFTKRNSNRGITYTPFAIVLDYYHGLPFGLWNGNMVFESLNPTKGDLMTQDILSMFYPGWNQLATYAQNQLVNTPFGDTADVLLQNASQDVLNSYPAIILSGDISFKTEERDRYKNYVSQGGILVLNSAYLSDFPEYYREGTQYELKVGKGKVIVYGENYAISKLPDIVSSLNSEFIPFEIDGDVQYLINVKNGSFVLTIINNNGVKKPSEGDEIIDLTKTQNFTVRYKGKDAVLGIKDWVADKTLSPASNINVTVKPGDISVLEFII